MKRLTAPLYLGLVYLATALVAMFSRSHLLPAVLEVRNVLIHSSAYLLLALIVRWSADRWDGRLPRRDWFVLLGLALSIGIGQEVLQTLIRARAYPINSMFDLLVDTTGAALGLLIVDRLAARRSAQAA